MQVPGNHRLLPAVRALDRRALSTRRAFTVIELLLVIAIIGVMMGLLIPTMQSCRRAGQRVKCMSQLRSVAYEFRLFADDFAAQSRGDSDALGANWLRVEDFQESLYRVDEFWQGPQVSGEPCEPSRELLMCPSGPSDLRRRPNAPCSGGAIYPAHNVSMAFNMRLHRAAVVRGGRPVLAPTVLNGRVLEAADAPLALDVDGEAAEQAGQIPFFTAPPVSPDDLYAGGDFWFPSLRHERRINVAFLGGHVLSSLDPLNEPGWRWGYQLEH